MKYLTLITTFLFGCYLMGESPQRPKPSKPEVSKPDTKRFPPHWGAPPRIQVRDMVKLPGKFGQGSSTLAKWIGDNLKKDAEKNKPKPKPKPRPKPPIVEIKEKLESYKESQASLQSGLLAKLKELGEKPSREEVKKTVEQFRKDNAGLIESQKELGKSINEWQKENRPGRSKRPEPPEAIKEQAQKVRETKKSLDKVKGAFHEALKRSKDLSKEERAQLVKEFKEANADNHKALKEAQKELQKQIREIKQEGDRRQ